MRCPCCREKTLRRYSNNNFQVIDLICINPFHDINDNVKYFQVKSSNITNTFLLSGQPYFSSTDGTIMVGSKKLGCYSHNIKASDDIDVKKILIGYICILFKENTNIIIDEKKSFLVLPDVIPNTIMNSDQYYYEYTNFTNHPQIKFNKEINSVVNLSGLPFYENINLNFNTYLDTYIIPINYLEKNSWNSIQNPLKLN
jgi:hypothetical protein